MIESSGAATKLTFRWECFVSYIINIGKHTGIRIWVKYFQLKRPFSQKTLWHVMFGKAFDQMSHLNTTYYLYTLLVFILNCFLQLVYKKNQYTSQLTVTMTLPVKLDKESKNSSFFFVWAILEANILKTCLELLCSLDLGHSSGVVCAGSLSWLTAQIEQSHR